MVVTAELWSSTTRFNVVQIHYGCHVTICQNHFHIKTTTAILVFFTHISQKQMFLKQTFRWWSWVNRWLTTEVWSDEADITHHVYEKHSTQNFFLELVHEGPTYERARVKLWNRVLSLMPPAIFTTFKILLDFAQISFLLGRAQFPYSAKKW